MNQRIRLDDMTDDELDALYERLAATEIALDRIGEWANGDVVTARNSFGDGYREAMRDIQDLLPEPAQRPAAGTGSGAATPSHRAGDASSGATVGP